MRLVIVLMAAVLGGLACGRALVLNDGALPAWNLPQENWQFYPLQWQTQPLARGEYADCEVTATVTVGQYLTAEPAFDTAHHARQMAMEQFAFQGGLVLRDSPQGQYRLQFDARDGTIALWKTPGNFLAAADAPLLVEGVPMRVVVRMAGPHITVAAGGKTIIDVDDRVAPLTKGKVFAGANHACMTFDNVKINRLSTASAPSTASHQPAFHVRLWCKAKWIFDGQEPVARIGEGTDPHGKPWDDFPPTLYSAKLRPGTREAEAIPICYRTLATRLEAPVSVIEEKPDKLVLEARSSDGKTNRVIFRITLTFDAARDTYVYDVDTTVQYLTARKPLVEVLDPWPYGIVGPAYPQGPQWDRRYSCLLWRGEDNRYYRQPINHYAIFGGLLSATQPEIAIVGEEDVNPHYLLYGDSLKCRYRTGLCTVMFDQHVQPTRTETAAAGSTEHFQWRMDSVSGAEAKKLLDGAAWSVDEALRNKVCVQYDPAGTTFDPAQTIKLSDSSAYQLFVPPDYYTVDPKVGHAKPGSLRIDAAGGARPVEVRDGASPFGRLFDGHALELNVWVRTEGLDGTFTVSLETYPKPVKVESQKFTGTTDWTRVTLRLRPQPMDYFVNLALKIDAQRGAKGSVWVDDVSLQPVGK